MTDFNNVPEQVLADAATVTKEDMLEPQKAIFEILSDTTGLSKAAAQHKVKVEASGLPPGYIENLQAYVDAFREVAATQEESGKRSIADKSVYDERFAYGSTIYKDIAEGGRHALRHNPEQLEHLKKIQEGNKNNDKWFDFTKLAVFGENNSAAYEGIGFDTSKFAEARILGKELTDLYAQYQLDCQIDTEVLTLRNQIYTLLVGVAIEVRDCGKYAFRDDPEMQKNFNFSIR